MNSLSWLIIFIGIFDNITSWSNYLSLWSFCLLMATFAAFVLLVAVVYLDYNLRKEQPDFIPFFEEKVKPLFKKAFYIFGVAFLVTSFFNMVVPKKEYMILAASSEIGEMVINSEAVQAVNTEIGGLSKDAIDLLKTYIQVETNKFKDEIAKNNPSHTTEGVKQ